MLPFEINVDVNALERLSSDKKHFNDLYVNQKAINPNLYIRLMPGHQNISSLNLMVENGFWINGQRYVSPRTFKRDCPIMEEVSEAKALYKADPIKYGDLQKLIESKNFSNKDVILFNVAVLEVKDERQFQFSGVMDNNIKILQTGAQLGRAITGLIANPPILDRKELFTRDGYVIKLSKKGSGMTTQYDAQMIMAKYEVPEELYNLESIPDTYDLVLNRVKSDSFLRSVIRNYLYGEPLATETALNQTNDINVSSNKVNSLMDDLGF